MNDPSREPAPSPSLAALEQIDRICLQFEQQWKTAQPPRLAAWLEKAPGEQARLLFPELLRLDLDYRARSGQQPKPDDYLESFPGYAALVEEVFEQFAATRCGCAETLDMPGGTAAARQPARAPIETNRDFGDYELIEEIARGGMGVVYKARHRKLQRTVALKMILSGQFASPEAVQRFHAEAQAAAQLDHPGIVSVFEVGQHRDQHYFSMAYVDGQSLEHRLRSEMSPEQAAQLLEKVAHAVHYAHCRGVVHRDLKPANILVDQEGQPRITDFGLAKLSDSAQHLTATGQILGTPGYMPPEQVAARHDITGPTADIYALGAILYRILTGRPPFQSTNVFETLFEVLEKEPIPPRALNRLVPADLETICLKCLDKDPRRRYRSAEELADDLRHYLADEPIAAQAPNLRTRFFVWARQRPALAITMAALFGFYTYHLLQVYLWHEPSSSGVFHWMSTAVVGIWLSAAWFFQRQMLRPGGKDRPLVFAWAAMEIALLTALLTFPGIDGPDSSLTLIYLLLLAGSALRGGTKLILFVYQLCLACYLGLVLLVYWLRPEVEVSVERVIPFVLSLSIIGLIQYMVLLQGGRARDGVDIR